MLERLSRGIISPVGVATLDSTPERSRDSQNIGSSKRSSVASVRSREVRLASTDSRLAETNPSAGGVAAARPAIQRAGGGSTPTPALHSIQVRPIPVKIAKEIIVRNHYLPSVPGGTQMTFGVFLEHRLMGAMALGVGPFNAHRLVEGAAPADCLTLSRLWLSEELPKNSESRVLGVVLRSLRKHTNLKFLLSYADPAQ